MNNDFWLGIWVMLVILFAGGALDLKCRKWEQKTEAQQEEEHLKGRDDIENY